MSFSTFFYFFFYFFFTSALLFPASFFTPFAASFCFFYCFDFFFCFFFYRLQLLFLLLFLLRLRLLFLLLRLRLLFLLLNGSRPPIPSLAALRVTHLCLPLFGPDNTLTQALGVLILLNRSDIFPHFSKFPCAYLGRMFFSLYVGNKKDFFFDLKFLHLSRHL